MGAGVADSHCPECTWRKGWRRQEKACVAPERREKLCRSHQHTNTRARVASRAGQAGTQLPACHGSWSCECKGFPTVGGRSPPSSLYLTPLISLSMPPVSQPHPLHHNLISSIPALGLGETSTSGPSLVAKVLGWDLGGLRDGRECAGLSPSRGGWARGGICWRCVGSALRSIAYLPGR